MSGAVLIDPPDLDPVGQQFILVQSDLYLGDQNGVVDMAKIDAKKPAATVFNGYVADGAHGIFLAH